MENGDLDLDLDLQFKHKRAKRRHNTNKAIQKQKRIIESLGIESRKKQPHRYAKMHATNCGDPNCHMCGNPRKFFKEPTLQEKKFLQSLDRDN